MRLRKPAVIVCVLTVIMLAVSPVLADRYSGGGGQKGGYTKGGGHYGSYYRGGGYYRGGYYRGGYYRGGGYYYGPSFGISIGSPWYYPYYYPYYDPYYYAPTVTIPSEPHEYIEKPRSEEPSAPSGVWYYCPGSKTYYPYVKECPDGWQTVPAQPPSEPRR